MRKILFVVSITVLCLTAQLVFGRIFPGWIIPNFVLIGVVFFNLYRGLRYSLGCAFLGGFLLDSYGSSALGINLFSFVCCSFLTAMVKKYFYQPGVTASRVLIVVIAASADGGLHYLVYLVSGVEIGWQEALGRAVLPGVVLTAAFTPMTLERLKACALKLLA